jgi:hypothetical protein
MELKAVDNDGETVNFLLTKIKTTQTECYNWFFLLIVFYFSDFLCGYGSKISHLLEEKRLFIKLIIFHLLVHLFFLYQLEQLNPISISTSIVLIAVIYLIAA